MASIPINPITILQSLRGVLSWHEKRLLIRDLDFEPDRILGPNDFENPRTGVEPLPFEFSLKFRFESLSLTPVSDCAYAVVVEYPSQSPVEKYTTKNFSGKLRDFNGLEEPELAPVIIQSDFENRIRFVSDDGETDTGHLGISSDVEFRIKVLAEGIKADECEFILTDYLTEWEERYSGLDLLALVDNPGVATSTATGELIIGEDLSMTPAETT